MNRQERRRLAKIEKRDRRKLLSLYNKLLEAEECEKEYLTKKIIELFKKQGEEL